MLHLHAGHYAAYLCRIVGHRRATLHEHRLHRLLNRLRFADVPQAAGHGRLLAARCLDVAFVDLLHKAAHLAPRALSVVEACLCVAQRHLLLGPRHRHVEQPPFLLQLGPRRGQERREQLLLHAHHEDVGKLQSLGRVYGHQAHLVGIFVLVFVLAGVEQHLLQELVEGAHPFLLCPVGLGALFLALAELLHAVEQLVDVLYALRHVGLVGFAQRLDDAAGIDNLFGQREGVHRGHLCLEALYHEHEVHDFLYQSAVEAEAEVLYVLQHRPDADVVVCRRHAYLVHRRLADAACGEVDDAHQALVVVWVHSQAHVAQRVLHLLAAVERDALVYAVRYVAAAQRVLHSARQRVLAVEDGEVAVFGVLPYVYVLYRVCHAVALVAFVVAAHQAYAAALVVVAPQLLLYLVAVVAYDAVGGVHDGLRGAVVLLQLEELHLRVVALEVEDVLYVGSAEGVDALCVVAHHADVLVSGSQFLDDEILRIVRVLVLVNHDVAEPLLVFEQHVGEVPQQHVHVEQQVVEVHGVAVVQPLVVHGVDLSHGGPLGVLVGLVYFRVLHVVLRREQVALGHRDAPQHVAGLVGLGVEVQLLHNLLDGRLLVVGVVDGEAVGVAQAVAVGAQHAGEDRVEGAHPDVACLGAHQLDDALLHLACRLVGEGQRQYAEGVHALLYQVRYAVGQRACLAAAGAGDDHHRPFRALRRLALRFVQLC